MSRSGALIGRLRRRLARRRWGALGVACIAALAVGVFLSTLNARDEQSSASDRASPNPTSIDGTLPPGHPSLDGSDQFAELTVSQLETEVADESATLGLRLTLVERYLSTGDIEAARDQARIARRQAGTPEEEQRSLRNLGWSLALLGDAERGAALLTESLELEPGEQNATWYLANVRLTGLDDAEGAAALFRQLLADDELAHEQRTLVEDRLAEAEDKPLSN